MSDIFNTLFSGCYTYQRQVSSPDLLIEGVAKFKKIRASESAYHEKSVYCLDNQQQISVQQRFFLWDDAYLTIQKNDHSVLHQLAIPAILSFSALPVSLYHTHVCQKDCYALTLRIESLAVFSTHYVIQGPAKDYSIDTVFRRE